MRQLILAAAVAAGLSGCASIVSGSTHVLKVNGTEGATVTVHSDSGSFNETQAVPATLNLPKRAGYFKHQNYTVEVSKPGFETQTTNLQAHVSGWYSVGNLFSFGLAGWLGVDPATGAMWTFDKEVDANLVPVGSAARTPMPAKTTATTSSAAPAMSAAPARTAMPAAQASVATAGATAPDHSNLKLGTWSYEADKLARSHGCKGDGAWLITQSGPREAYREFCDDGHTFTAVCDSASCSEDK